MQGADGVDVTNSFWFGGGGGGGGWYGGNAAAGYIFLGGGYYAGDGGGGSSYFNPAHIDSIVEAGGANYEYDGKVCFSWVTPGGEGLDE